MTVLRATDRPARAAAGRAVTPAARSSPRFRLAIVAPSGRGYSAHLHRFLSAARRMLRGPLREMTVVLVDDATMAGLHRRFMNRRGPTDVLTFPLEVDRRSRAISGEVYVCVAEARRRAREQGTRVRDELLLYALHGMLHLSGFDDRTPAEFQRMHRTEDRILSRLGVGAVFWPRTVRSRQAARGGAVRRPAGRRRADASAPTRRASAGAQP